MVTLEKLTTQTESIREMVKTISNIATQTNLIALNAGIQAAHAGEHGGAFNVVAKEVRKLANESKQSTEDIHAGAEDIIEQVRNISKGTTESEKAIRESNERIEQALYEFQGISKAAKVLDVQAENLVSELQL